MDGEDEEDDGKAGVVVGLPCRCLSSGRAVILFILFIHVEQASAVVVPRPTEGFLPRSPRLPDPPASPGARPRARAHVASQRQALIEEAP